MPLINPWLASNPRTLCSNPQVRLRFRKAVNFPSGRWMFFPVMHAYVCLGLGCAAVGDMSAREKRYLYNPLPFPLLLPAPHTSFKNLPQTTSGIRSIVKIPIPCHNHHHQPPLSLPPPRKTLPSLPPKPPPLTLITPTTSQPGKQKPNKNGKRRQPCLTGFFSERRLGGEGEKEKELLRRVLR